MPPKPDYYHDLKGAVSIVKLAVETLGERHDELRSDVQQLRQTAEVLAKQNAVLEQRLAEVAKPIEENDRRWWGLVTVLVIGLLSLAATLIVAVVKK
ncbi:MAG: hypothetical protein K2X38_03505 [Gemmataceae bacterium]|nr:hypothetical protein [Gemmataceae bacterium]